MKKVVIGLGVVGVFAVYSLGIRHQNPVISKPSSLASSSSSSGTKSASSSAGSSPSGSKKYKDGTYTGSAVNVYYGNVQVSATVSNGKITDVKFLQYPYTHATSVYINKQVMPYLKQEAIKAQNANVQIISGATYTSEGFRQSLQSALAKA